MKGLFIKDLLLIKNQKRTLPLLFLCGIVMSFSMQPTSGIIYLTILTAMLCAGTLSYDEMDHGYAFLFTLPVSRRIYVREKYIFSVVLCLAGMLLGLAISLAAGMIKGGEGPAGFQELISFTSGAWLSAALMLGSLIPVRLKYGTEKSSIVLFVLFALVAAAAFLLSGKSGMLPGKITAFLTSLAGSALLPVILFAAALLILCVSEQIAERIALSKEF